ncbi:MAG: hypothetical protein U0T32_12045 [Chitinophagales bacterium]
MEMLTPMNIFLLLCGLFINALYALQKAKKEDRTFSLGYYLKDNWVTMVLTVVTGFVCLVLAKDLITVLGISVANGSSFYSLHALVCGIIPQYFIEKLIKLYK